MFGFFRFYERRLLGYIGNEYTQDICSEYAKKCSIFTGLSNSKNIAINVWDRWLFISQHLNTNLRFGIPCSSLLILFCSICFTLMHLTILDETMTWNTVQTFSKEGPGQGETSSEGDLLSLSREFYLDKKATAKVWFCQTDPSPHPPRLKINWQG